MYTSENDVHIFIEWFYNGIKKIIEEMILFSSSLDCDSLILVLFWTRTLRFPTGNSRARKLSTRAQQISRFVVECLDHGNNFVCYEPSAVNSSVGGSKLHSSSSCTFLFRIFPIRVGIRTKGLRLGTKPLYETPPQGMTFSSYFSWG